MEFGRTITSTFISLRNRNFKLYFSGQIISNTGNWLTNVALTLLVLNLTGSGLAVGVLAACQYGPILFLSAWAGAFADRTDKHRMLLITQSLEMLQSAALATLAFLPHPPIVALYLVALFGGMVLAFDNPLRRSFVSEMVRGEDIPNAVVLYSTIVNVSRIFGPALAGLLIVSAGFGWCFALDAASYIAVLVCLLMMRRAELFRRKPKPRTKGEVREGMRYVLSMPLLWISYAMLAVIGTLSYNFTVTLPLFVTSTLHGTDATFTILYSVFSFGAVVCALLIARRGAVKLRDIVFGALGLGIAMLVLSAVSTVALAAPIIFFMGMASILYMNTTTSIAQVETRHDMQGRVLALQMVLVAGTTPIGGPLLGFLADSLGARSPLILGGIACLLAAAFGYWASNRFNGASAAASLPSLSPTE